MNDIERMAYLQAMDVDCYVSRWDLPGAKTSHRVALVSLAPVASALPAEAPEQRVSSTVPAVANSADTGALGQIRAGMAVSARSEPAPAANAVPGPSSAGEEMPVFSLAVTALGGRLWLEEIPPGRDPGDAYRQLLLAMARALGLSVADAQFELFNFPVSQSARLGRSMEAARELLQGFLGRRREEHGIEAVVLLGDLDQPWFDGSSLAGLKQVRTVAAWQMLRDPTLKPRAWADLKPLRYATH